MGSWKITIEGTGSHHNGKPFDANEMANAFVRQLKRDGHSISEAAFLHSDVAKDDVLWTPEEKVPHPSMQAVLQFFAYQHLPSHLQIVSKPFSDVAAHIAQGPNNPEATVALRKLLEAKDAAVRAHLFKSKQDGEN